ncbi:hypothetical protein [Streptomyces xantholiticus]|uniref:Uncharacterized protein n=1 Tax=Streptomyces xantholiticus TaxID=68285 RepID=A0ABV1UZT6_9ACTN
MRHTANRVVPYITAREGEAGDLLAALRASFGGDGRSRLGYWDETPEDRGPRGELWGRCSQDLGTDRLPQGRPRWRMVHPARQRETMMKLLCQVCVGPTKVGKAHLFLESSQRLPSDKPVLTAQPPICPAHAPAAVEQCPHLRNGHTALLVHSAPLHGVIGTPYQWSASGLQTLPGDDEPLPYTSPMLRWFLASQLVRTIRDYTVVDLDDLPSS